MAAAGGAERFPIQGGLLGRLSRALRRRRPGWAETASCEGLALEVVPGAGHYDVSEMIDEET